nr:hypothetical protein [Tanacetum cinerariifolium]
MMNNKACFKCGHLDHLAYDCGVWVEQRKTCAKNNYTHKSKTPRNVLHKTGKTPMRPNRPNMNSAQPKRTSFAKPTHSYIRRLFQRRSAVRTQFRVPRVSTVNAKFPTVNKKFPIGNSKLSTADLGNKGKVVKASACWIWRPKQNTTNKGLNNNSVSVIFKKYQYIDTQGRLKSNSGCSRHMTGNISYLSDYEPYYGGYVSFGQGGGKITSKECIVLGRDFKLKDDTNVLLKTHRQHNMYSIYLNNIVPHKDLTCLVAMASTDESVLWHNRLGHLNFKTMNKLVRHNLVRGLPSKCFKNDHTCVSCLMGKQHKASCKTKLVHSVSKPLRTLHMDLFGPTSVSSLNHKWYCLVVTDDFSRFTWTFFLKTKDETSGILRNFITEIENLKELKAKAVNTACYVQNRVLVNKSQNKTPYELFNGRTHAIGFLKPFVCYVMILNTLDNLGKFDAKGDESYFIGYSMSRAGPNWLFDIDTLTNSMNYVPVVVAGTSSTNFQFHETHLDSSTNNSQDACNADAPESSGNSNPTATSTNPPADHMKTLTVEYAIPTISSLVLTACLNDSPEPSSDTRLISKRVTSQDDIPFLDNILTLSNKFEDILGVTTNTKPKKIFDALKDPSWVEAMQEELLQFKIQNVWSLVDCPKGVRPIRTKWVLKNKKDKRGIVIRNKARLVAQGHTQEEGIDYEEVFAPVARIEAIRLFLAYASFMGFTVYQMDVKSAFLYGTIDEEVYVMQPPGFQDPEFPARVYKVEKAMGTIDQTLFIRKHRGDFILVQVYVDDFIFGSSNLQLCREFEALMHEKFKMSAMDVKSANTPMDKENPWGKDRTGKDVDLHLYRSMIRSLMYLTASKPDIMFATIVVTSTTKAEYVAAASGCGQVMWIQNQLLDYGIETTDEGTKILATVDGKLRTISESSIRRNLKLNDEEGISTLPDAELFENLARMGYNILPNQKFTFQKSQFSHQLKYLIHTIMQCLSPKSTGFNEFSSNIATVVSSALPTAADEPASPLGDDSQGKACPIVSGLEARQDRVNIIKTSTLPHDSTPRVTSLAADEGSMQQQLNELTDLYTRLQRQQTEMATKIATQDLDISNLKAKIKFLEDKDGGGAELSGEDATIKGRSLETREEAGVKKSTKRGSNDTEELVNVLTSLDATSILKSEVQVVSIPSAAEVAIVGIPIGSGMVPTASLIFNTASMVTPYSKRKGKEKMVESDTPKKKKLQEQIDVQSQIARDAEIARIHAEEELQMLIDGLDRNNETIAKYLQEYEQFVVDLSIGEKIDMINELVKYQDHYAKVLKYQSQQRKPLSKKQQREFYMSVLKSHFGWKTKHFKGMTLDEIREKFIHIWKQIEDFTSEEVSEEDLKVMMQLVLVEEVYVEALQVKHPIIGWEIYSEGQRTYWKIIRLGGHTAVYQFFVDMLKHFDREDLTQLWTLVRETLSIRQAIRDKEKELWVELKRLYEPDVEDQLWTHT